MFDSKIVPFAFVVWGKRVMILSDNTVGDQKFPLFARFISIATVQNQRRKIIDTKDAVATF